jgi:hypothetical protein
MENVTVIIPIHELKEDFLAKAIKSVDTQKDIKTKIKVLLVYPKEIELGLNLFLKKNKFSNIIIIKVLNNSKTDFQSQINLGVENTNTEYFSILEFDDEYSNIYFRNVDKHIKIYPEVNGFIPLLVEVNTDGDVVKLTNEFVWSKSFINDNEFGFITNEMLLDFSYFFISGGVFKKESFISCGGLKSDYDVSAVYEFLLRYTYNNNTLYVIPKIGYSHLNDREGSATNQFLQKYKVGDSKEEFERARKNHIFI